MCRSSPLCAGYIPNCAEAVEAMLAAASIGAIWSSTSPDFGVVVSMSTYTLFFWSMYLKTSHVSLAIVGKYYACVFVIQIIICESAFTQLSACSQLRVTHGVKLKDGYLNIEYSPARYCELV